MPWVGFEPAIPESKQAKTVHALDSAATVIGMNEHTPFEMILSPDKTSSKYPSLCWSHDILRHPAESGGLFHETPAKSTDL
jgi:hypothetical protein